jgi:Pyruvate/2-oxoacid:ferredoxin oxidoreductase delta subunit
MTESTIVPEHRMVRHLVEVVITPEHAKRQETAQFRATKKRLKEDGHYQCWVCGCTENLQVHHYAAEWSLEADIDYDKLKEFVTEQWDVYGYGKLLKKLPITSVDDIRNMMVLCLEHHTSGPADGSANGIHEITFPVWISQKLAKTGMSPVPREVPELAKSNT